MSLWFVSGLPTFGYLLYKLKNAHRSAFPSSGTGSNPLHKHSPHCPPWGMTCQSVSRSHLAGCVLRAGGA